MVTVTCSRGLLGSSGDVGIVLTDFLQLSIYHHLSKAKPSALTALLVGVAEWSPHLVFRWIEDDILNCRKSLKTMADRCMATEHTRLALILLMARDGRLHPTLSPHVKPALHAAPFPAVGSGALLGSRSDHGHQLTIRRRQLRPGTGCHGDWAATYRIMAATFTSAAGPHA